MGKPRQLTRLGRDRVQAVIRLAPSLSAAARQLGVSQGTVSRWVQAGKVQAPGRAERPETGATPAAGEVTPAAWGAEMRRRYVFGMHEAQLLVLAEEALTMARDPGRDDGVRLAASRQFAALLKQLVIPVEDESNGAGATTRRDFARGA
jgi:transposase-like protein